MKYKELIEAHGLTLHGDIEHFANLVAAQEREACIKVCMESKVQAMDFTGGTYVGGYFANAIKQRGETK